MITTIIIAIAYLAVAALNGYGTYRMHGGGNIMTHREWRAYQAGMGLSALFLLAGAGWVLGAL